VLAFLRPSTNPARNDLYMAFIDTDMTQHRPSSGDMILDVRDLACRRGERIVFTSVNFQLHQGELIALTGRNGAGKSSLLAILAGRLRPYAGAILTSAWGDAPLSEAIHLIGHRDALKAALTARENLAFARDVLGRAQFGDSWTAQSAAVLPDAALARVGLAHAADLPAGYLSAGQKRRLALARVLVCPRPLWLLDEPSAALDTAGQALLASEMKTHLVSGGAIIAATHGPLGLPANRDLHMDDSANRAALATSDDIWGAGA
jgi:heme exporter protein A